MSWSTHSAVEGLGVHSPIWDALNEKYTGGHPLLESGFIERQLLSLRPRGAFVCTLSIAGIPAGICLVWQSSPGRWKCGDWAVFAMAPALFPSSPCLAELLRALPGVGASLEVVGHDPAYGDLHRPGKLPTRWERSGLAAGVPVSGTFDAYWAARPQNFHTALAKGKNVGEGHTIESAESALVASADWSMLPGCDRWAQMVTKKALAGRCVVFQWHVKSQVRASIPVVVQGGHALLLPVGHAPNFDTDESSVPLLHLVMRHAFEHWGGRVVDLRLLDPSSLPPWTDGQRAIQVVTVFASLGRAVVLKASDSLRGLAPKSIDPIPLTTTVHNSLHEVSADARALLDLAEVQDTACGAAWYKVFCGTVMRNLDQPRWLSLRRGQEAIALIALNRDPGLQALGGSVGALANFYSALYTPALAPGTTGVDLVPAITALRNDFGSSGAVLRFAPMDPDSDGYGALIVALRGAGYAVFDYFCHGNWIHPADDDWARYLAARPGEVRNTIKRAKKKLLAEGARIEVIRSPQDVDRGMRAFEQVYAHSWKKPEPVPDFMPELARECAKQGWLRLGLVWLGDEPIAAQFWIVAHGRADIYKLAYNEVHKRLAAGTVLTAHLMEQVMTVDRVQLIDYLIGDDPYKQQWMTQRRERRGLVAYNLRSLSGCLGAAREAIGRAIKRHSRAATAPTAQTRTGRDTVVASASQPTL